MEEIKTNIDRLREIALDQHGFVTTSQAGEAGVTRAALAMLVRRDRIERVERSVYRVPQVPSTQYDRLALALLWTGCDEATLSHQTALDTWDVCDIYADEIHVTVPRSVRIRRSGGEGIVVHHEDLGEREITWWELMPIVKPAMAMRQCVASGVQSHLIEQAARQALVRGMVTEGEATTVLDELRGRFDD